MPDNTQLWTVFVEWRRYVPDRTQKLRRPNWVLVCGTGISPQLWTVSLEPLR